MELHPFAFDQGFTEPESAANTDYQPLYPYNNVTQTESGHRFEMDDTPTRERVRLNHRSGTFIEMHPNGDEVHKVYGDGYEITIKNKNVHIQGRCTVQVEGNCNLKVKGDYTAEVDGDYNLLVGKKFKLRALEDIQLDSNKDVEISAQAALGGMLRLSASECMFLDSDLEVKGSLNCDNLTAKDGIQTGDLAGVKSGLKGFVTETGGLVVGFPGVPAVPGSVLASATGTFGISVQTPILTSILAGSVLHFDLINTMMYNTHIHSIAGHSTAIPTPMNMNMG